MQRELFVNKNKNGLLFSPDYRENPFFGILPLSKIPKKRLHRKAGITIADTK
ncbi:hypothetical protein FEDK69T_27630 [Flavobacterium enshiense DK69]|nr:hypothetical protein FEDK69T_27630 [Flavobacterium enshiense DK69]